VLTAVCAYVSNPATDYRTINGRGNTSYVLRQFVYVCVCVCVYCLCVKISVKHRSYMYVLVADLCTNVTLILTLTLTNTALLALEADELAEDSQFPTFSVHVQVISHYFFSSLLCFYRTIQWLAKAVARVSCQNIQLYGYC
jgi:hypothetical protein